MRILFALCLGSVAAQDEYRTAFRTFKQRFGKTYADAAEEESRFAVFKDNYIFINAANAKGVNTYELGVNAFTDLTEEQFSAMYFGYKPNTKAELHLLGHHEYQGEALASSMDWRTSGAVTPVKNQGQCGSCWSFSTTGALEGAWKIASGKLVSLSEEEFVQCDTGSNGCGGGSMVQAFGWAETQGVCTEASYQYTSGGGTRGSCHKSGCQTGIPSGGVTGYKSVGQSEQALMSALNQQPVSIAVEADKSVFQSYRSGIMNGACGMQLDHGILAIGYGTTDSGTKYWLVKNSWGEVWGEQGFGKLLRGKNSAGECGILMQASYPVVSNTDEYRTAFNAFKQQFERKYKDAAEEEARFAVFKMNLMFINQENGKDTNAYKLGVNDFTDLTLEQFGSTYFGFKPDTLGDSYLMERHEYQGEALAASMDWRTSGAVTPVKNQGQCGSCWSFSTTGALEGAWKIASGTLVSLSEEEFVQCDTGSNGCGGGSMRQAFDWAESQGLCTETSYQYTSGGGTRGSCHKSGCQIGIPSGGVTGYKSVAQSEQALMSALNQQPVSIAVEADKSVFQSYRSGIMNGACGTQLDHGILAVGYGSDSGKDYWIVKNSWGTVWGEQGFGRLDRGKNSAGECGILMQASYPVVTKSAFLTV